MHTTEINLTMDLATLRHRLEKNPGQLLEPLATQCECRLADVIECLPAGMWQRLPGSCFAPLLDEVHRWQTPVTLLVHSEDVILEFTAPLPAGEISHGFYNLQARAGLHGHLRFHHCAAIYLVDRTFMNKRTVCLVFCNQAGEAMFKIFAGRDEAGNLLSAQLAALADFAAIHAEQP